MMQTQYFPLCCAIEIVFNLPFKSTQKLEGELGNLIENRRQRRYTPPNLMATLNRQQDRNLWPYLERMGWEKLGPPLRNSSGKSYVQVIVYNLRKKREPQ